MQSGCILTLNPFSLSSSSGGAKVLSFGPRTKYVVWTAFCADGTSLPPVIFTKDDPGPPQLRDAQGRTYFTDGNPRHFAFVHQVRKCAPSHTQTAQWVFDMTNPDYDYLAGSTHIFLDKAPFHTDHASSELWTTLSSKYGTEFHFIPSAGGKWLNPCDQAIHHELRCNLRRWTLLRPQDALRNVISSYYDISEQCVRGAWRHTRLLAGEYCKHLTRRESEGYHSSRQFAALHELFQNAWDVWSKMNLRLSRSLLPEQKPLQLPCSTLDGYKWTSWQA